MKNKDGIGTIIKNERNEHIIATDRKGKVCLIDMPKGVF